MKRSGSSRIPVACRPGFAGLCQPANIERLDAPARRAADLQQIGGSHAQRDVFDRITIEAALRGGYGGGRSAAARPHGAAGRLADGYAAARLSLIDAVRVKAV
jgi:hypothetical protein